MKVQVQFYENERPQQDTRGDFFPYFRAEETHGALSLSSNQTGREQSLNPKV